MQPSIHFEQFVEEIRSKYPSVITICATEQPLTVRLDGQNLDPAALTTNHHPLWLEVSPESIPADGKQASLLSIHCPDYANQTLNFNLIHGTAVVTEQVALDPLGNAELEICTHTPGIISIQCLDLPVRAQIKADEIQEAE
jgi:hypothetical protein